MIQVRAMPSSPNQGRVIFGSRSVRAAIGRSGISSRKTEGDGVTPLGRYRFVAAYYRRDRTRRPRSAMPIWQIRVKDGWCDDPRSPLYNRPVQRPYTPSHETLHRDDQLYDLVLVLDHNQRPRRRFGGSAIFIHAARPDLGPTEGCVALPIDWLIRLAATIRPGDQISFATHPRPVLAL